MPEGAIRCSGVAIRSTCAVSSPVLYIPDLEVTSARRVGTRTGLSGSGRLKCDFHGNRF